MTPREMHLNAFKELMDLLRQSIFLAARAINQYPMTDAGHNALFKSILQRYADVFGRSSYQAISLIHLFESAMHAEALLIYEYNQEAEALGAQDFLFEHYTQQAIGHKERINRFIDMARRTNNLNISPGHPFVMPYRGIYIVPCSDEVQMHLASEQEYYMGWNEGIVAIIRNDDIDKLQPISKEILLLYYDADELLDQAENLDPTFLDAEYEKRLQVARNSTRGIGEPFAHYLNSCLLKQNAVLLNLYARLKEGHPLAHAYCERLVTENIQQLQAQLLVHPSWAPEEFFQSNSDAMSLLIALEKKIKEHSNQWVEKSEKDDAAGLLFQFKAVLQGSGLQNFSSYQDVDVSMNCRPLHIRS